MFKSKTVFIVGAGASREAGLPTGEQLKDVIASKLNITYKVGIDPTSPDTGDAAIAWALVEHVRKKGTGDINSYLFEAWKIRDAMPQAISIDNYIDAHSTNPGLVLCGKLAIVQSIIKAERKSKLFINDEPGKISDFDHNRVKDTWYLKFFQLLTENVRKEEAHTVFDNLSFIIFNYDRCVEHYLYHALQNYYSMGERDVPEILARLKISHPYGAVGRLPWQNSASVVFGGRRNNMTLLDIAADIRTFTERMEDDATLVTIRNQVQEAETVVFLGFAFHPMNIQLLSPETPSNTKRVFGTCVGISNGDLTTVRHEIVQMLKASVPDFTMSINHNQLTCGALFDEYWRTLSRG